MKKLFKSVLCLSLFVTTFANAQWSSKNTIKGNGKIITEKRTTTDYDEIKIAGFFDIELIAGKEGNITLLGEENIVPKIKTEVENGVLKIYTEKNISLTTKKKLIITIPFETLNAVTLAGSGDVTSKAIIKTDDFSVKLAGSGDLNLIVDAANVDAQLSGSGDLNLSGKATKLKANVAGSGAIAAAALIAQNAEANVSGSGAITLYCTAALKARVSGSGDVFYKGDPKTKDTKVSGSGAISKK